ncbi:prepilin-type N-terminal cleavage/methylation domain-containing protein [Cellulomonas fimi]|uniref:Prepilin-type N-terminal cleavage/methylation domain-containing protein n=1 Tax=Cellulomonas fimi TaxID=1708 RepID=A0A7Y0QGI3_CELFI|nr:prepilin-type N-terminal cleavage/methylation domain-containing protein [Cellulomonas fimi]NMR20161.1 prepilin-type N-terminal cleavage/methylation domain-containing protein [Cellulomonas fimi]
MSRLLSAIMARSVNATREAAQRERGLSLPELLVTMFLLGLISTMVLTLVVTVNRTFTRDRAATDSSTTAAIGMNELTRVIRSGTELRVQGQPLNDPVFVAAGNESVMLYAFIDTDEAVEPEPIKVRFSINGNRELVETRWAATPVSSGGKRYWVFPASTTPTSRVVTRQIPPRAGSEPYLFTFLKEDGTAWVPPASPSKDQLREIVAVTLTLKVQADVTARAEPVTLANSVGIPNLGISRVGP